MRETVPVSLHVRPEGVTTRHLSSSQPDSLFGCNHTLLSRTRRTPPATIGHVLLSLLSISNFYPADGPSASKHSGMATATMSATSGSQPVARKMDGKSVTKRYVIYNLPVLHL